MRMTRPTQVLGVLFTWALAACTPELQLLDFDGFELESLSTLLLAVEARDSPVLTLSRGEAELFVVDLEAREPFADMPRWKIADRDLQRVLRVEAYGYRESVASLGLSAGPLAQPESYVRAPPPPARRGVRVTQAEDLGRWEPPDRPGHLDAVRFPPYPCPKISVTSAPVDIQTSSLHALARLEDGRLLLAVSSGEALYILDRDAQRPRRVAGVPESVTSLLIDGPRVYAGTFAGRVLTGRIEGDELVIDTSATAFVTSSPIIDLALGARADQLWALTSAASVHEVDVRLARARLIHRFQTTSFTPIIDLVWNGARESGSRALAFMDPGGPGFLLLEDSRTTTVGVRWGGTYAMNYDARLGFVAATDSGLWQVDPSAGAHRLLADYNESTASLRHIVPVPQGLLLVTRSGEVILFNERYRTFCPARGIAVGARPVWTTRDEGAVLFIDSGAPHLDDSMQALTIRVE